MTDSVSEDERLRAEAAAWIARMQRADADTARPELDVWLAADPRHRRVYERMSARFGEAALLRHSAVYGQSRDRPRRSAIRYGAGLAALAAAASVLLIVRSPVDAPVPAGDHTAAARSPAAPAMVRFETGPSGAKAVHLADGSFVTLDRGSLLEVMLGRDRRDLVLRRGRARFDVAHEARPFVVTAGGDTVTARGTIFDVAMEKGGKVRVALLRGAVDVTSPGTRPRRLAPGQQIALARGGIAPAAAITPGDPAMTWADGLVDYDAIPLGQLIKRANRYAARPIVLGDPALACIRASGRFRVDDPDRLQANLARLFDLTVDTSDPREVVLRRH
jgi:transmembrane sensor